MPRPWAIYAGGPSASRLTMQDGAATVDLLAIPLPGNVFRRGIVAVYPNAYRFHELDWLDSPPPGQRSPR